MPQLNQPVPDFALPDLDGVVHHLGDYRGRIVIVNFWSAECPWSERADKNLMATLNQLPGEIVVLPVASNANETDELIRAAIQQRGIRCVLRDSNAKLADEWQAQTTPHAFVIDREGILRYRGAVDDVTFRKRNPQRFFVEEAVEALLDGKLPASQEMPPYGCTIVRPD